MAKQQTDYAYEDMFVQEGIPAIEVPPLNISPIPGGSTLEDGVFQSPAFRSGNTGWYMDAQGNAEFRNLIATGVQILVPFVARTAITAGQAVAIGDGSTYSLVENAGVGTSYTITTTAWSSQQFATQSDSLTINTATVALRASVNGNYAVTLSIRANSAGAPTGADLVSVAQTCALTGVVASFVFTFTTPLTISATTQYHIVVRRSGAEGNTVFICGDVAASPASQTNSSANSGSTWAGATGPLRQVVQATESVSGQVSQTTASTGRSRTTNFIGFAYETKSAGELIRINVAGIATRLSALSTGVFYYLSDTAGAVSTTAGTFTRKVGIAVSATQMLITNIW